MKGKKYSFTSETLLNPRVLVTVFMHYSKHQLLSY